MSTKVKERLKRLALELDHDQRVLLDNLLAEAMTSRGIILVSDEEKPCDVMIEKLSDNQVKELVKKIKKKKKIAMVN